MNDERWLCFCSAGHPLRRFSNIDTRVFDRLRCNVTSASNSKQWQNYNCSTFVSALDSFGDTSKNLNQWIWNLTRRLVRHQLQGNAKKTSAKSPEIRIGAGSGSSSNLYSMGPERTKPPKLVVYILKGHDRRVLTSLYLRIAYFLIRLSLQSQPNLKKKMTRHNLDGARRG